MPYCILTPEDREYFAVLSVHSDLKTAIKKSKNEIGKFVKKCGNNVKVGYRLTREDFDAVDEKELKEYFNHQKDCSKN